MNRFSFRYWDKNINKMRHSDIGLCSNGYPFVIHYNKKEPIELIQNVVRMQCTGIKDKNGQFIYEGDILKIKDVKPYVVVRYKGIGFELYAEPTNIPGYHNDKYIPEDCEIVGNIYENADLIEGGADAVQV